MTNDFWFIEESPVTENNEASEEIKEPQSELSKEINSSENDKNAKEEAPAAPVEASSEPPRGLGMHRYVDTCNWYLHQFIYNIYPFLLLFFHPHLFVHLHV